MTSNEKEEAAADFSTFFGGLYPVQKLATTNVSFSEKVSTLLVQEFL